MLKRRLVYNGLDERPRGADFKLGLGRYHLMSSHTSSRWALSKTLFELTISFLPKIGGGRIPGCHGRQNGWIVTDFRHP